jgi:hypothetical protein
MDGHELLLKKTSLDEQDVVLSGCSCTPGAFSGVESQQSAEVRHQQHLDEVRQAG